MYIYPPHVVPDEKVSRPRPPRGAAPAIRTPKRKGLTDKSNSKPSRVAAKENQSDGLDPRFILQGQSAFGRQRASMFVDEQNDNKIACHENDNVQDATMNRNDMNNPLIEMNLKNDIRLNAKQALSLQSLDIPKKNVLDTTEHANESATKRESVQGYTAMERMGTSNVHGEKGKEAGDPQSYLETKESIIQETRVASDALHQTGTPISTTDEMGHEGASESAPAAEQANAEGDIRVRHSCEGDADPSASSETCANSTSDDLDVLEDDGRIDDPSCADASSQSPTSPLQTPDHGTHLIPAPTSIQEDACRFLRRALFGAGSRQTFDTASWRGKGFRWTPLDLPSLAYGLVQEKVGDDRVEGVM